MSYFKKRHHEKMIKKAEKAMLEDVYEGNMDEKLDNQYKRLIQYHRDQLETLSK